MILAKILTADGPAYFEVERQGDGFGMVGPVDGPAWDPMAKASAVPAGSLEEQTVLAPVRPTKIVCVGRNYRDHAAELGNDAPTEPLLFLKPPSSLLAPGGTVRMPAVSQRVDFEGELGVVIGKRCYKLGAEEDVAPYIFGYTLVNDVTARDLQKSDSQWTRGKGFDTFCPVGPVIATELALPVTLETRVNGEVRQTGSTADFIFDVATLIRYISQVMTLEPGDLIPTGTPAGVGALKAGDRVEVAIAGLGVLRNEFAAE